MADNIARILIVDDEKINLKVLANLLKEEYVVLLAKNGHQALSRAQEDPQPDLILLDVIMPGMGGYEVIKELKHDKRTNHIPVIFVTALGAPEEEEQGLKLGAVDYITKPISPPIVKMRVRNHLQLIHKHNLLEKLAKLDGLTEIPNRRSFEKVFEQEFKRSYRNGFTLSLLMLDIDYFKQYNDYYGHQMGDNALKAVAKAIMQALKRPGDFVARFGGEEFVMILPETSAQDALMVAERVRTSVLELRIPHCRSNISDYITVSIGVAANIRPDTDSSQALLERADQHLYLAKQVGRNRVVGEELLRVDDPSVSERSHVE